jgi:hypothetical protein
VGKRNLSEVKKMNEHIRNTKKGATATAGVIRRNYIGAGILTAAVSAAMIMNFSVPTMATNKMMLMGANVPYPEHPNVPEGNWEIEPLKSLPPKYDGHIHLPIPFVDGKLAVSLDRIDRTNSQIEFSISKKWLGQHKIKRIGFASVRWYGFAIDNAGLYEANKFDDEWTTKLLASKFDYEEIKDQHNAGERYFWIKPTFDLFYEWSNDVVFMVQLDDDQYYNGRVFFKNDCMGEWYPGKDCRVKSFDTTKTSWNVRYAIHDAPKKYQEGMKLRTEDGYLNSDAITEKKENEVRPEEPKKPDTPKTSDEKKGSEESKKPEKQDETTKKENSGDSKDTEKPGKKAEEESNKTSELAEKEKREGGIKNEEGINKEDKRNEHHDVVVGKPQTNLGGVKNTDHTKDKEKNNVSVLAVEKNISEGSDAGEEDKDKTEIEVENEAGAISQDDNDQVKEIENKNENKINEVPKLGETKKENTGISLWWAWFIGGTVLGATLHKIFFSIRSKKKSISN